MKLIDKKAALNSYEIYYVRKKDFFCLMHVVSIDRVRQFNIYVMFKAKTLKKN